MTRRLLRSTALGLVVLQGCATPPAGAPPARPAVAPPSAEVPVYSAPPAPPAAAPSAGPVSATLIPGSAVYPAAPTAAPLQARPGSVRLNFPGVDAADFAKAVLGQVLGLPYAVDPSVHAVVNLVTPTPVARADVLPMVEDALRASNLVLELRGGAYTILPVDQAKAAPPSAGEGPGFGQETLTLRFANPVELKKIIDPVVPGVITAADAASGTLVLTGASGQRKAVRDLVQQFDLDWMKGMSFALFVPRNTDARLIAPDLQKLIDAPGSTTAGLVRLVAMEHLNGIIAIAARPQYLDDVHRWVEVLDREGQSTERRLYVYRVQNGRAGDLAKVLVSAFGGSTGASTGGAAGQRRGFEGTQPGGQGAAGAANAPAGSDGLTPAPTSSGDASTTLPGQSPTPASGALRTGAGQTGLVITSDETNNAVVAYATPREYALIEDALRRLDIVPLQVVIEAAISEVTLNDALQYGTQWYFQTHSNQYALTQGSTAAPVQNFPGFAYTLFNGSAAGGITSTLNALSTVTHVQILSAPNLLVLNNQTASLEVGDQVPVSTGSAVSTVTANAPVVNSVDYRDTGVILKVTPRVNSNGLVLLDISQEVSQVDNSSTTTTSNPIDSPVISERKIASSIAVQDGQTVALGGLIQDDNSKTRNGVPILSAIPVLGGLVGSRNNTRARTELLVLLTPKVIRNPEEAQAITEELKAKIKFVEPLRPKFEP